MQKILSWSLVLVLLISNISPAFAETEVNFTLNYNLKGLSVTDTIVPNNSSVRFDLGISWSTPGAIIFLYQNNKNYYRINFAGSKAGLYRTLDGEETKITLKPQVKDINAYDAVFQGAHSRWTQLPVTIYFNNDGEKLSIAIDKFSDESVEFFLEETDAEVVEIFKDGGKVGQADRGKKNSKFVIESLSYTAGLQESFQDYYVNLSNGNDENDGSQLAPFKTIQKAASLAKAGSTVYIAPGIYRESSVTIPHTGNKYKAITFTALDPSNKPILDGAVTLDSSLWSYYQDDIYTTTIDWKPSLLYFDELRMFLSTDPNQASPDDLTLDVFLPVNFDENTVDGPKGDLIDSSFFTQADSDYYQGATLVFYNGFSNATGRMPITGYNPDEHRIFVSDANFSQPTKSRFTVENHPNFIDKDGEWAYRDNKDGTYTLFARPYANQGLDQIAISKHAEAFSLAGSGSITDHIIFDNLEIRHRSGNGMRIQPGHRAQTRFITISNSDIHDNSSHGIAGRAVSHINVLNSSIYKNTDGVSFSHGYNFLVKGNDIFKNRVNGIWGGSGHHGAPGGYRVENYIIQNNHVHDHSGRKAHPDGIQFEAVNKLWIDGNLFEQDGHQNQWSQQNGIIYYTNNIVKGGPVGLNSCKEAHIYNNVFDNSLIRFDSWAETDPYYQNQKIVIRNNIINNTSLTLPPETHWETAGYPGLLIDHNLVIHPNSTRLNTYKLYNVYDFNILDGNADALSNYVDENYLPWNSSSQLIDGGANFKLNDFDLSLDHAMKARFQGDAVDIGPYEQTSYIADEYPLAPDTKVQVPDTELPDNYFYDDFNLRFTGSHDLAEKKVTNGLSWDLVRGTVYVTASKNLNFPGRNAPEGKKKSLVVTKQGAAWTMYEMEFDISKRWGPKGVGFVLLYKGPNNYYWFNIRTGELFKRRAGVDQLIAQDGRVLVNHQENNYVHYLVQVEAKAGTNTINIQREGGEMVSFTDSETTIIAGGIGFKLDDETDQGLNVDNVVVKLVDSFGDGGTGEEEEEDPNQAPVAQDANFSFIGSMSFSLDASDADGDSLEYIVTQEPSHGTLTGTGSSFTYLANSGYVGADSFSYKVNDGKVDSNIAAVSLTIQEDQVEEPEDDEDDQDPPGEQDNELEDFNWTYIKPGLMSMETDSSGETWLKVNHRDQNLGETFAITGEDIFQYDISFDIRKSWTNDSGLILYYQDSENYYYFAVQGGGANLYPGTYPRGEGKLIRVKNGIETDVAYDSSVSIPHLRGELKNTFHYDISTTRSAGSLAFNIKLSKLSTGEVLGDLQFTDSDPILGGGKFGLQAEYQKWNTTYYNNLEITETSTAEEITAFITEKENEVKVIEEIEDDTYFEDFDLRDAGHDDITSHKTANDLAWTYINPALMEISIDSTGNEWLRVNDMTMDQGSTFAVSDAFAEEFELSFDIRKSWTNDSGVILNYQDENNYYFFGVQGSSSKLYPEVSPKGEGKLIRVKDGVATIVAQDGSVSLPHLRAELKNSFHYEISSKRTEAGLSFDIKLTKKSSGEIYGEVSFTDSEPLDGGGRFGLKAEYQKWNSTYYDNILLKRLL